MASEGIDKRALRKIVRTYIHEKGSVPEDDVINDLVRRHKVDEASIARAIKNQIKSRRIERVPGVGLRERQLKRRKRRKTGKVRKARLVTWHYERGDVELLEDLGSRWLKGDGLRELMEHRDWKARKIGKQLKGVYALYKNTGGARTIYYVGRAQDLPSRVKTHLTDRLHKKWDEFSVYGTTTKPVASTLESILIKVARPEGNKNKLEKLPLGADLRRMISSILKAQAIEHEQ